MAASVRAGSSLAFGLVLVLGASAGRCGVAQDTKLFAQSAWAALEREFAGRPLSWIVVDGSGRVLAKHWEADGVPIAPGSLVKPFAAWAYGEQHHFVFPHAYCVGAKGHCWLPRGHGSLGLEEAIAQSCNAYFLALAAELDRESAQASFVHFGLQGPPAGSSGATLIGLGGQWRETPLALLRGYLALAAESRRNGNAEIVQGMRAAARTGTAKAIDAAAGGQAALAKTGTAVCMHRPRAAADGFTVVLYPAEQPRVALLVRMHGATGAQTAAVAGAMLRTLGVSGQ